MPKIPKIIPVTDLRQDAAAVLSQLKESSEPFVITQRGRAAAVLLNLDAYEKTIHERDLLRVLARGEKDISDGRGHSLESILEEADELLADEVP